MVNIKPPSPPYVGPSPHVMHDANGPWKNNTSPLSRIVMHGTVSPCQPGGARQIGHYFCSPNAGGSAHYVVDPKEVVQVVWDSEVAEHAPPNEHSIGVELCDEVAGGHGAPAPLKRWNETNHKRTLDRAAQLVAQLCLAYDVPVRLVGPRALRKGRKGICEHSDVSVAFHQSTHWDLGNFPRRRFLRLVKAEAARLSGRDSEARKHRRVRVTLIDRARDVLGNALSRTKRRLRKQRIRAGLEALPKH